MTVRELIIQLAQYHPDSKVEVFDGITDIKIERVAWRNNTKYSDEKVIIINE